MAAYCQPSDCQTSEGRRQLRSADSRTCVVRQTYNNFGNRCFADAGPRLWNSLPAGLGQTDIGHEQSFICLGVEIAAHCDYLICASSNFLTYLLTYVTRSHKKLRLRFVISRITEQLPSYVTDDLSSLRPNAYSLQAYSQHLPVR